MIKRSFFAILATYLISCSNNSSNFEGEWKCDNGSNTYKFEKINDQSYLYYYESGKSETATVTGEGILEMRGFVFTLNLKTGQLVLPSAWSCDTATRIE